MKKGLLLGKGPTSTAWHIVRRPHSNEGVTREELRRDRRRGWFLNFDEKDCIKDRDIHLMSLCSHVWEVTETTKRAVPEHELCQLCLWQIRSMEKKTKRMSRVLKGIVSS